MDCAKRAENKLCSLFVDETWKSGLLEQKMNPHVNEHEIGINEKVHNMWNLLNQFKCNIYQSLE